MTESKPKYYNPNRQSDRDGFVTVVAVVIMLFFALAPIYWAFNAAFEVSGIYVRIPPPLLAWPPSLQPLQALLTTTDPTFLRGLFNTFVVAALTAAAAVLIALPGGYALTRFIFRGRTIAWVTFFVCQVAASATFLVIPMYIITNQLGLYDTYGALLIPYIATSVPFASLLMSGFVAALSPDIEDAAMVHGSSRLYVMFRVTLPLILPGLLSAALFIFATVYSEFILATTLTATDNARTAFPMLWIFYTGPFGEWGLNELFAGVLILSLPVMILFIIFQRRFIEGFTKGMLKM